MGMTFKVIVYDDDLLDPMTEEERTAYIENKENYGFIIQKEGSNPSNAWTAAYVTGHKYKVHFGEAGLDFMSMNARLSKMWTETDRPIHFVHNHTEQRDDIELYLDGEKMENDTILPFEALQKTG